LANTKHFTNLVEESFANAQDAVRSIAPSSGDPYGVKAFRVNTGADLMSLFLGSRLKTEGDQYGAAKDRCALIWLSICL